MDDPLLHLVRVNNRVSEGDADVTTIRGSDVRGGVVLWRDVNIVLVVLVGEPTAVDSFIVR